MNQLTSKMLRKSLQESNFQIRRLLVIVHIIANQIKTCSSKIVSSVVWSEHYKLNLKYTYHPSKKNDDPILVLPKLH